MHTCFWWSRTLLRMSLSRLSSNWWKLLLLLQGQHFFMNTILHRIIMYHTSSRASFNECLHVLRCPILLGEKPFVVMLSPKFSCTLRFATFECKVTLLIDVGKFSATRSFSSVASFRKAYFVQVILFVVCIVHFCEEQMNSERNTLWIGHYLRSVIA